MNGDNKWSKWFTKERLVWLVLTLLIIVVRVWSKQPDWVERYYSKGLFLYVAEAMRWLTAKLPVSLGDIGYTVAGIVLIRYVVSRLKQLFRKQWTKQLMISDLNRLLKLLAVLYIGFNLLWGLNYNRLGIAEQLNLKSEKYTTESLKQLTIILLDSLNRSRAVITDTQIVYPAHQQIFNTSFDAYANLKSQYPFLKIDNQSIKKSLFGRLGNWVGYLGYYNPFTGESQVNLAGPKFLIPFVTCHEIAHQLGYASESEANFTGYLAASASKDPLLRYSCYFDMFHYANRELYSRDSIAAKINYNQLNPLIKNDFRALKRYLNEHKNPIEPIIKAFYDQYLKANQQMNGVDSYNEVTGWLIAYHKKYGKL